MSPLRRTALASVVAATALIAIKLVTGLAAGSLGADPVRDRVYCVNFGDASMTVIDGKTNAPIGEIKLDYAPCKIAVDAARGRAYIANSLVSTVAVVDLDRQELVETLTVERAPMGMALGRHGERIYAANRGTGRVSVIDRASGREWARAHAVQLLVIGCVAATALLAIIGIDLMRAWASQGFPGRDDLAQRGGAALVLLSLGGFLHWLRRGCQTPYALKFFTARSATRLQPAGAIAAT